MLSLSWRFACHCMHTSVPTRIFRLCLLSFSPSFFSFFFCYLHPLQKRSIFPGVHVDGCRICHIAISPHIVCMRVCQKRFRQSRLVVCTQTLLTCEYLFKLHILCIKYSHLKLARISKFKFPICVCMPNIMRGNVLHRLPLHSRPNMSNIGKTMV